MIHNEHVVAIVNLTQALLIPARVVHHDDLAYLMDERIKLAVKRQLPYIDGVVVP
jgi:hypothetical protein